MPYIKARDGKEEYVDGIIRKVSLPNGKTYGLECSIITVKPIVCPKCGGRVELKYGEGECEFCKTRFTSKFELVEDSAVKEV